MASYAMRELKVLRDYCGDGNPVIDATFTPGRGWQNEGWLKRASASWLRKLRARGVTHIAVEVGGGRAADFTIDEVLKGGTG